MPLSYPQPLPVCWQQHGTDISAGPYCTAALGAGLQAEPRVLSGRPRAHHPQRPRAQQAQPGPSAPPQARPLPSLHTQVLPASLLPPPPRGGPFASHQPQPPRGRPSAQRGPRGPPPPGRGPTPASPHGPAPLGAAILAQAVPPSDRRAHRLGRDSVILRLRFPFRSAFRPHRCPPRYPIFPHRPEERER